MQPLTDIIDAVYTLRTNGLTLEAFQEILRERRREEELLQAEDEKRDEFEHLSSQVNTHQFRSRRRSGAARLLRSGRRHAGGARIDRAQERPS